MTVRERLHQIVEELPEEAAGDLLRIAERQFNREAGSEERSQEATGGFSTEFLATFGGWKIDPRTTEEILDEIRSARTMNREITL